ncbi:hypothetical protein RDWZM_010043 [Blomia tropicalis]|uniref:E3 ubiquitin-protein ligase parkin n=1 Tax=Blomia tropicalis TaxID=40697 RepID=A0A9Q0RHC2_BLOTA|nr:hypothetical protein RDWZM_010043 [Blomia tropicalis]
MDTSTKRMNNYEMIIKRSMKVEDVKRELHQRINEKVEHWSKLAILFMGRELPNELEISGCDLGDYSMLHALDSGVMLNRVEKSNLESNQPPLDNDPPLKMLPEKLIQLETTNESANHEEKLYFFVYCTQCESMRNGKLRVGCNFYFKCIDEHRHDKSTNPNPKTTTVLPLNRLRRNTIHRAQCLACMESETTIVLVFQCDHVLCIDCFRDYCKTTLTEHNMELIDEYYGYTINCPIGCPNSWIESCHIQLMESQYHKLYKKFSNEESIQRNGGIQCPYRDCDEPFYPQTYPPTDCSINECSHCHLIYCIRCTYEGLLTAPEHCEYDTMIEKTNTILQESKSIEDNTLVGNFLIEKFNQIRRIFSNEFPDERLRNAPKWHDTMSKMRIREIAKPCPKCRTPIERNGGCMHMVCTRKRCNFNWCWICMVEWNSECMGNHWFGQ